MMQASLSRHNRSRSPYAMPADILSAEHIDEEDTLSLRADGSHEGVCYLEVIRALHDGTYLVRIASHPDCILTHGYTLVLSEAELALAHAWDGCVEAV